MNVFNREMKRRQKNWAASLEDGHQYDYLRDEVRLTDYIYSSTLELFSECFQTK